jgi:hypothetical protein
MPLSFVLLLISLFIAALYLFIRTHQKHNLGLDAPEQKCEIQILDKQSVPIIGAKPEEESEEYWLYVQQTKGGPKRQFCVGIHYFYALEAGDTGILTYQGRKFIHFAKKR